MLSLDGSICARISPVKELYIYETIHASSSTQTYATVSPNNNRRTAQHNRGLPHGYKPSTADYRARTRYHALDAP